MKTFAISMLLLGAQANLLNSEEQTSIATDYMKSHKHKRHDNMLMQDLDKEVTM